MWQEWVNNDCLSSNEQRHSDEVIAPWVLKNGESRFNSDDPRLQKWPASYNKGAGSHNIKSLVSETVSFIPLTEKPPKFHKITSSSQIQ